MQYCEGSCRRVQGLLPLLVQLLSLLQPAPATAVPRSVLLLSSLLLMLLRSLLPLLLLLPALGNKKSFTLRICFRPSHTLIPTELSLLTIPMVRTFSCSPIPTAPSFVSRKGAGGCRDACHDAVW